MTYNDEALIFPIAELYDLGVMNKYIDALHEQYLRGEKEYQDYVSKYGDFTSASPYDVAKWNQLTMDPIEQKWNLYTEAGIDPLRNREAMFDIMSTARRVPRELLAALRQNAEAYKVFNASKMKLLQEGLYNPLLNGLEGDDPEMFSTIGDNGLINMFNRQSPTPIHDIADFSADYYKDLKPIIKKESRNGIDYSISQITPEMLMDVAMNNIENIINTPQGRLMYRAYLQQMDGDELAAAQLLAKRVAMSLKDMLLNSEEFDDNFFNFEQLKLANRKLDLDEDEFEFQKDYYNNLSDVSNPSNTTQSDLSYTTLMELNSIALYNKMAGIESPADYALTTYDISKYWEKKEQEATTDKDKKYARDMKNHWNRMSKEGLEKAENNGVLVRDKNTGELIPSDVYSKEIGLTYGAPSTGKTSLRKARELADIYYNRFVSSAGGTAYASVSADLLSGNSGEKQSFPGGAATNKYRTVLLDDREIYFTPFRRMLAAGYNVNSNTMPLHTAFNEWLKGSPRLGFMINTNTTTASLPTPSGRRTREISGYVRIPIEEFNEFVNLYKKDHPKVDDQTIYDGLGLSFYEMLSRTPIKGRQQWIKAKVVEIPITRVRINNKSAVDSAWNNKYDEITGGKASADKKSVIRLAESLNK